MIIKDLIGNTPLVKLNSISSDCDIYVKLEYYNLGGSIKARAAYQLIEDARKENLLYPGCTLIEATGGNTGVAMSIISNYYGYNFCAVVPDNYSKDRIKLLELYGAKVILSDHTIGNDSHIIKKNEMLLEHPSYICLDQFNNISSINAHYYGTGVEIINVLNNITAFVAGVGSSGTFTGISRRLKEESNNTVKCFVVQPEGCNIINGSAISHEIQGISVGIKPPLLNINYIDGIVEVNTNDVKELLKTLCKNEGLFLGISSGANILAAIKLSKKLQSGTIVTVAPDYGNYYLDFYG